MRCGVGVRRVGVCVVGSVVGSLAAVAPWVGGGTVDAGVSPAKRFCMEVPMGAPGDLAVVNLTPVNATAPGSGQLIPSDTTTPPEASNVNFATGTIDPNVAVARIGTDGAVCFSNSVHATVDIVADLLTTITAASFEPTSTGVPLRLVDTRIGRGGTRLQAGERLCFGTALTPGSLALVNLTPVGATTAGNGVLTSSGTTVRPTASNVNFGPGTVDPNLAVATVGTDRALCFWNSVNGPVDLVADLLASIDADAYAPTATGSPTRLVDTRIGLGAGRITASERRCFATQSPPGTLAIVNLTPIGASAPGSGVLVGSTPAPPPTASSVNFAPGTVDPNVAIAPIGTDGQVCFVNSVHGPVDLVADLLATIDADATAPTPTSATLPIRLTDTRPNRPPVSICPKADVCYRADPQLSTSTDGGTTWQLSEYAVQGMTVAGFRCWTSQRCIAVDNRSSLSQAALVTVDGGTTWRRPAGVDIVNDLACAAVDTCLVVGTQTEWSLSDPNDWQMAVTTDDGRTWRSVTLPPAAGVSAVDRIECYSLTSCTALGWNAGARRVLSITTTDGWQTVDVIEV